MPEYDIWTVLVRGLDHAKNMEAELQLEVCLVEGTDDLNADCGSRYPQLGGIPLVERPAATEYVIVKDPATGELDIEPRDIPAMWSAWMSVPRGTHYIRASWRDYENGLVSDWSAEVVGPYAAAPVVPVPEPAGGVPLVAALILLALLYRSSSRPSQKRSTSAR